MKRRMLLLALASLPLAACGRKSRPVPPEGAVYPRTYPDIDAPEEKKPGRPKPETETP